MKWLGHVAHVGEMRNAYICVRKHEGKRPLRWPRCRWDDIRMDVIEIGWKYVYWIHMAQDQGQW